MRQLIAASSDRVTECDSVEEAWGKLPWVRPDMVTIDFRSAQGQAVKIMQAIRSVQPTTAVACVVGDGQDDLRRQALEAGVAGVVTIDAVAELQKIAQAKRLVTSLIYTH
jgi:DNA-binding NarL/FixJ family response regulator